MPFRLLFASCALSLALSATILGENLRSRWLETQLEKEQTSLVQMSQELNRGEASRRYVAALLQELSAMGPQKPQAQTLLGRYGLKGAKEGETP